MQHKLQELIESISHVLYGKDLQIQQAITCLITGGHLLIEDLPGMGKTTLAHALAKVLGLDYQRVQFTSDMLPADILGVSVFNGNQSEFVFHKGPIFTQLLLADEINRTTPKTQSALLEAMEERQVTIESVTYTLPDPFFVIATQNPISQYGTFPLPESQLDRFLMRIQLGYPSEAAERELLTGGDVRQKISSLKPCVSLEDLSQIRQQCSEVKVSNSVLDYLQRIVRYTRESDGFEYGISPRGSLALLNAVKAWAYLHNREFVLPDDIQMLLEPVIAHRLRAATVNGGEGENPSIRKILTEVDVIG